MCACSMISNENIDIKLPTTRKRVNMRLEVVVSQGIIFSWVVYICTCVDTE
jgi:heme O synthase-like polyprenyltransferase